MENLKQVALFQMLAGTAGTLTAGRDVGPLRNARHEAFGSLTWQAKTASGISMPTATS
jgi:hypothetical protein